MTMKNMKYQPDFISIIIPIYNAEKWIQKTIENIKEQTYTNYEIILVDDASTDRTREIIDQYQENKIKSIYLEQNKGPATARNEGLNIAIGQYICFQDADDLWSKNKLEKQLKFMKQKQCAFSYTAFEYVKKNKHKRVNIPNVLDYQTALKNTRILPNAVMFDREKIDIEFLKMPNIPSEDIATWWKILKSGYLAYGLNETLSYYCVRPNSRCSNKLESAKGRWNLYRKIEKFSFIQSVYYFGFYVGNAVIKRL